jgi:hypothetical protein
MDSVKAFPAKAFFVNMLTRDIHLSDAILDLLDNCVDGILRSAQISDIEGKPYEGYCAKITINNEMFSIEDNCGGIPLDIAKEYAFRMGRPENSGQDLPTVGIYGIGMKRAIFKMGRNSTIYSYNNSDKFKVEIDQDWLGNDSEWTLPLQTISDIPLKSPGTLVKVTNLYEGIAEEFGDETYINNLKKLISNHYSFIINKGFKVIVNESEITPHNILFIFTNDHDDKNISPYIYQSEIEGVRVDLKVGIYRETPTEDEIEDEQVISRTSEDSGWTIICNDRVVLYNDKTILTGWGEANVPNFHNQFIGIAGVVHFQSNDVEKLPLTTTKRGIDGSSKLYIYVKKYMREGTKIFTSYTNQIKKEIKKEKEYLENSKKISFDDFNKDEVLPKDKLKPIRKTTTNETNALRFKPNLPIPSVSHTSKTIHFFKEEADIQLVSNYLFETPDRSASEVGSECFNVILKRAQKEL